MTIIQKDARMGEARGRPSEFPLRELKVGESFRVYDKKDFKRAQSAAHSFASTNKGYKFSTDSISMRVKRIETT